MFNPYALGTWFAAANAWGEIATLSPLVVAMRTSKMGEPTLSSAIEPMRMVTEKMAAAHESALEAGFAASRMVGLAMLGRTRMDAPFVIASAAAEPVRRRVKANVKRLSKNG
jgi:hypothetical protein